MAHRRAALPKGPRYVKPNSEKSQTVKEMVEEMLEEGIRKEAQAAVNDAGVPIAEARGQINDEQWAQLFATLREELREAAEADPQSLLIAEARDALENLIAERERKAEEVKERLERGAKVFMEGIKKADEVFEAEDVLKAIEAMEGAEWREAQVHTGDGRISSAEDTATVLFLPGTQDLDSINEEETRKPTSDRAAFFFAEAQRAEEAFEAEVKGGGRARPMWEWEEIRKAAAIRAKKAKQAMEAEEEMEIHARVKEVYDRGKERMTSNPPLSPITTSSPGPQAWTSEEWIPVSPEAGPRTLPFSRLRAPVASGWVEELDSDDSITPLVEAPPLPDEWPPLPAPTVPLATASTPHHLKLPLHNPGWEDSPVGIRNATPPPSQAIAANGDSVTKTRATPMVFRRRALGVIVTGVLRAADDEDRT